MKVELRISGVHYDALKEHLFPADGKEAVAVALCGRHTSGLNKRLLVHDLTLIPHSECDVRERDLITWPTERIIPYFHRICKQDFALVKIHSHPGGYPMFSEVDDSSDNEFFNSVFGWAINSEPHASAVMLPTGRLFGRVFYSDLHHEPLETVFVAGDTLIKEMQIEDVTIEEFSLRTVQAFGDKTYHLLKELRIGIVGCSGTGSPLIEQLVRLGVGSLVIIDPDVVEHKNLNRILHTSTTHADHKAAKVDVIASAIKDIGLGTTVTTHRSNVYDDPDALESLVSCDVIFGCMDTVDGRYLINQLCSFYLIPYFDLGVKLEADGTGGISKICATVHYLQPGMSSLISRGVYTLEDVQAAGQFRRNPIEFAKLRKEAYIKNVNVNSPAVISVNMQIASHAVNEFLNRIHPYKSEEPSFYAGSSIDLTEGYIVNVPEHQFEVDNYLRNKTGRGDMIPFIEMPELL